MVFKLDFKFRFFFFLIKMNSTHKKRSLRNVEIFYSYTETFWGNCHSEVSTGTSLKCNGGVMSWEKTLRVLGSVPLHSYPIPCSSLSFNSLYLSTSKDCFPERLAVPGIQSSSLVLVWFSVRSMLRTFCRPITIYQDQLMLEPQSCPRSFKPCSYMSVLLI